ncbi:MAG TPA: SDR family oxidoreductase [Candidatus Limnocylindria bacterium]|nr:SDR family oxidoreductase [Candidatus Limnocylindria bacterium]
MRRETYLITGAGSGFGRGISLELAKQGKDVIAAVEHEEEVRPLLDEAAGLGLSMRVEKLDVTDPQDRAKAEAWDADVLLNNAGVTFVGSLLDIPEEFLRRQFEVNVFGTILLTKIVGRGMVKRGHGRIVFMSSASGLMSDPLSGPYGGSKFAVEGFAESLARELQEFHIEVATINPGPYMTGFNDREYETWKLWKTDPKEWLFDYPNLAFPYEQFQPHRPIAAFVKVLTGETRQYRNVVPKVMGVLVRRRQRELWRRNMDEGLGERFPLVKRAHDIDPATTPLEGLKDRIEDLFGGEDKGENPER